MCPDAFIFSLSLVAWLGEAVGAFSHSFDTFSPWL